MFRSRRTKTFKRLFDGLPVRAQRQARADYQLFKRNARHPRLQFKSIGRRDPSIYSVRAGEHYRAIGFLADDTGTWFWIGTHADYNNIYPRL